MLKKQILFVSIVAIVLAIGIVGITNASSLKKNSKTINSTQEKCSCGCDMDKADCPCGGTGSCKNSVKNTNSKCGVSGENKDCGCLSKTQNTSKTCTCGKIQK